MPIKRFQDMMSFLREEVRYFCREYPMTLDEVETFAKEASWFCWCLHARGKGNEVYFRDAVERFIRNEILRVCA